MSQTMVKGSVLPSGRAEPFCSSIVDVVVSAWAGHSDLSFTKRVYVHPNIEHLRPAAVRMDKILGQA